MASDQGFFILQFYTLQEFLGMDQKQAINWKGMTLSHLLTKATNL
jgi:hypothetical protein